jgi:hypothetical protein
MVRFNLLFFSDHIETLFVIGQNPKLQSLSLAPQKLVTHGTGLAKCREIIWQTSQYALCSCLLREPSGWRHALCSGRGVRGVLADVVLDRRKHVTCTGL